MANIIICGAERPGVEFAARMIAAAAIRESKAVRKRSCGERAAGPSCHLRTGERTFSAEVAPGQADLILALEPGEAVRALKYLKKDGCLTLLPEPCLPEKDCGYSPETCLRFLNRRVKRLHVVSTGPQPQHGAVPEELPAAAVGAALKSGVLGLGRENLERAIREILPPDGAARCLAAFARGYESAS